MLDVSFHSTDLISSAHNTTRYATTIFEVFTMPWRLSPNENRFISCWLHVFVVELLWRFIDVYMLYMCEYKVPTYWANCWLEINGAPATQQAICMAGLQTLRVRNIIMRIGKMRFYLFFQHEGEEIFHCEVLFRRDSVPTILDGCWFFAIRFNTTTAALENGELCARGVRRFG